MARLTKKELEVLQNIANKQGIIGKKKLEEFIWCNTTDAKYEIGDKVIFTRRDHQIYGNQIVDWVGTVTKRSWITLGSRYISYELEVKYEVDGMIKVTTSHVLESDISGKNNRLRGINKVTKKSKYEESLSI